MARLDRMAPVKEVAQVGAAIGREFSSRLLASVLDMNAAALGAALGQLVEAGLLVNRGGDLYAFKHALTRDAAYTSLLRSRRRICHQRIANALEEFDNGFFRAAEPELLAYHYQEAGISAPPSPAGSPPAMSRSSTRRFRGGHCPLPIRPTADGGWAAGGRGPHTNSGSPANAGQCANANGRLPL